MLVEHFADLRHLSRVPLYDRPALLRAAVAVDALATTYGQDNYLHPDTDRPTELVSTLLVDLLATDVAPRVAVELALEVEHVENNYPAASPDRAAMVSDLARRLVEEVRS